LIKSFRTSNSSGAYSFLFGKNVFNQLLAYPGVAGVAFVKGTKSSGQDALVLIGVSESGEIQWDRSFDDGQICPPNCPKPK